MSQLSECFQNEVLCPRDGLVTSLFQGKEMDLTLWLRQLNAEFKNFQKVLDLRNSNNYFHVDNPRFPCVRKDIVGEKISHPTSSQSSHCLQKIQSRRAKYGNHCNTGSQSLVIELGRQIHRYCVKLLRFRR